MENRLPTGGQMLELEAAALLGMSRTPVREAMVRLAKEGLVEIRPRHGMRVLPLSADDMAQIYEVLTGLELAAADSVARRGLSETEIAFLEEPVGRMDAALAADDLEAWAKADEEFHFRLVDLTRNDRLIMSVKIFWDQAHRARMATLRLRPRPTASNADHAALVEAIKRRDAEEARRIHYDHRHRSGEMLVALLRKLGLTRL